MNVSGFSIDDPGYDVLRALRLRRRAELQRLLQQGDGSEVRRAVRDDRIRTERKKLVKEIDHELQKDGVRPVMFHTRANTCWHPYVKGITLAENSQYNHWRFEDAWLDK